MKYKKIKILSLSILTWGKQIRFTLQNIIMKMLISLYAYEVPTKQINGKLGETIKDEQSCPNWTICLQIISKGEVQSLTRMSAFFCK